MGSGLYEKLTRSGLLISHEEVQDAGSQKRYSDKPIGSEKFGRSVSRNALMGLIDSLESSVKKLKWEPAGTEWADYYDDDSYTPSAMEHKQQPVREYVGAASPRTLWDLGANNGCFSRIAAAQGADVVSLDFDPACVEQNYRQCVKSGEKSILPLVMDLSNPSPGIGWNNRERQSIVERGPVDAVMALALIHHLAISNNVPLDMISEFAGRIALYAANPETRSGRTWAKYVARSTSGDRALKITPGTRPPDIYYFLLDEYAGEEVLRGRFGYDNSAFLGFLRDRGLFVAPRSRSNYLSTHLCLPALLNSDYLDVLSARAGAGPVSTSALTRMATDCTVVRLLKGAGYRFVFVPSGFQVPSPRAAADEVLGQGMFDLTEFDRVFLDNSILQPLNSGAAGYRRHVLRSLRQLDSFPIPDQPTFVFAHITVTHRPYLFDAEGNPAKRRLLVKKGGEREGVRLGLH